MGAVSTETDPVFDPFTPGFVDDPYPEYARVRETTPISHNPLGIWFAGRHADVAALLRSGLSVEARYLTPTPLMRIRQEATGNRPWRLGGLAMLDRDPPDHTRLRKLVAKVFTPRAVAGLEPLVTELVDAALDRMAAAGSSDLVAELAFPLPFEVISRMLGMPDVDHTRLRAASALLARSLEPTTDPALAAAITAADADIRAAMGEAIAIKRAHPGDDLLSALITAEDDGDVLNDDELIAQVGLLYLAGHETTVNLIANGMLALLAAPDQYALLHARPDLAGNAVEELLRYDSPVQYSRRITIEPYPIGDVEVPAGSIVFAGLASANRDPRRFGPDADLVRLDREEARHQLSFGSGAHHCLGAALARLEGAVALRRLAQRFPGLALDGDVERNGRLNLRGLSRLPVHVG